MSASAPTDWWVYGAGITAAGTSKVTVNNAKIHTVGSIRITVVGCEEGTLEVNDSELFVKDGTKPCYLSGLEIVEGAVVAAPAGKALTMTVDGKETAVKPGTYAGKIVLTVG